MVCPVGICVRTDSLLPFPGDIESGSVDLSKATKLKDVIFRPGLRRVEWVIKALQTITLQNRSLRQLIIHIPRNYTFACLCANGGEVLGEPVRGQWPELDRFLVEFWESHSIPPKVIRTKEIDTSDCVGCLLPEVTRRGILDLVECSPAEAWSM
jgi:hypothetical protein